MDEKIFVQKGSKNDKIQMNLVVITKMVGFNGFGLGSIRFYVTVSVPIPDPVRFSVPIFLEPHGSILNCRRSRCNTTTDDAGAE